MLMCDPLDSDLEEYLQVDKNIIPPSIPSTIPLNNPKTIQIPRSLVDSSLVSHYYISIQNPTEKSDGAWISFFKLTKNHKEIFFGKYGHKSRLSDG